MIIGIGVDTIEIARMADLISIHQEKILSRLFTEDEITYCSRKLSSESYAARFAAKEALLKSTGIGLNKGFRWKDFEILNDNMGKPFVRLNGLAAEALNNCRIHISLTHTKTLATAFVIVEKKELINE